MYRVAQNKIPHGDNMQYLRNQRSDFNNSWSCLILTLLWIQRYTMYPLHLNYTTTLPRKTITMKITIFIIVCVLKSNETWKFDISDCHSLLTAWKQFIISAKWTKWMAEIMRSYGLQIWHTCSQRQSGHDRQKFSQKGAWPWSRDPLNFWALNVNSSKTVRATDFKFDTLIPRDSPDMTHKNFPKRGRGHGHVTP